MVVGDAKQEENQFLQKSLWGEGGLQWAHGLLGNLSYLCDASPLSAVLGHEPFLCHVSPLSAVLGHLPYICAVSPPSAVLGN